MRIIGTAGSASQSVTRNLTDCCTAKFTEFGERIGEMIEGCSEINALERVGTALRKELTNLPTMEAGIDTPDCCYERQVLYCDPKGRFTMLGLCWKPGAETPVHGHNAWGAVGVVSGSIGNRSFEKICCENEGTHLKQTGEMIAGPGAVATVTKDPGGIHALFNPTDEPTFTVHIYGMDLREDHGAINVMYARSNRPN